MNKKLSFDTVEPTFVFDLGKKTYGKLLPKSYVFRKTLKLSSVDLISLVIETLLRENFFWVFRVTKVK